MQNPFLKQLFQHKAYLAALLCALTISVIFSFKRNFPYSYQVGEKWQYHSLYAPFQFNIEKTSLEVDSITNALNKQFVPHLTMDKSAYAFANEILNKEFKRQMGYASKDNSASEVGRNSKSYFRVAEQMLKSIYDKGILPVQLVSELKETEVVIIVKGEKYVKDSLSELYTVKSALDYVRDSTPYMGIREPEFVVGLLSDCFQSNLVFDNALNATYKYEALQYNLQKQDTIKAGELLVANDAFISKTLGIRLDNFRDQYWSKNSVTKGLSLYFMIHWLICSILLCGFVYFAKNFERHKPLKDNVLLFILGAYVLFSFFAFLQSNIASSHTTIVPFAILALYLRSFLSKNISLVTFIILAMIASLILEERYEFLATEIAIGIVVVFMSLDLEHRSSYIKLLSSVFAVHFVFQYIFHWVNAQQFLDFKDLVIDCATHILSFMNFIPILPLFDHWIHIVSDFTLARLIEEDLPLLQTLKAEAPGTFEHSQKVANMAYQAAKAINARPLLAKAGGLYHDIGKLENPTYFLENGISSTHHDSLLPLQSAEIIKLHVQNGIKIAERNRLPNPIINIIRTHHGDSRIESFFRKHQQIVGNDDDSGFYYEGPKPSTKEEAIVMLADSVDAAFRRYASHGEETAKILIHKVIDSKWKNEQLSQSIFSFKDIETCKNVFEKILLN